MLYVIISDSHGNKNNVKKIIEYSKNSWNIDKFVYLGDGIQDFISLIDEGILHEDECIMVKGNCDINSNEKDELLIKDGNTKILITHGHKFSVKFGLEKISKKAKMESAKIVLFGHTHIEIIKELDNITFINPGSCSTNIQFALLEINNGKHYETLFN